MLDINKDHEQAGLLNDGEIQMSSLSQFDQADYSTK